MTLRLAAAAALFLTLAVTPSQAAGPSGETLFKQRCGVCHTPGKSMIGPDPTGLFNRKARPAFNYSPAMQEQPAKWTATRLDTFLSGPQKSVPGTKMTVSVTNPADRALIIAYLRTLK